MTDWLRALTAPLEYPGLIPSTHITVLCVTPVSRDPSIYIQYTYMQAKPHTHKICTGQWWHTPLISTWDS